MKKRKKSITLNRVGFFTAEVRGPDHIADVPDGLLNFKYDFTVKCTDDLDSRGFLYDQLVAQDYFGSIKTTALSAEHFTEACFNGLINLIGQYAPHVKILEAKLVISTDPYNTSCTVQLE